MRKTLRPSPKFSLNSVSANVAMLYDDVVPTLRRLCDDGYKLAIVSNWDTPLDPLAERLGIAHYFDIIVASHDERVRSAKPDPHIFEYTSKAVGVSAEEAVHVGDTYEADIIGAQGVGIRPILTNSIFLHINFHEVCKSLPKSLYFDSILLSMFCFYTLYQNIRSFRLHSIL